MHDDCTTTPLTRRTGLAGEAGSGVGVWGDPTLELESDGVDSGEVHPEKVSTGANSDGVDGIQPRSTVGMTAGTSCVK